jgi:hypothetical protein
MERDARVDLGCIIDTALCSWCNHDCAKSAGRWSAGRAVRVWSEKYDFGGWADNGRTAPGRIRAR